MLLGPASAYEEDSMTINIKRSAGFDGTRRMVFSGAAGGVKTKTAVVVPPFITANLIHRLDTSNPASYSGSGSTVTDLQGNSNATLENSPTYTSGYLTFNGSNQSLKTDTNLGGFYTGGSEVTSLFVWAYPISAGNILVEHGESAFGNTGWICSNIEISSGGAFSFGTWNGGNMNDKVVSSAQSFSNWYYVGWTYDGTTMTGYVNGASVGTVTFDRAAPYNYGNGLYYNIGMNCITNMGTNSYCNMRFGEFHVYNALLSAADVLQNFDARRGNYGL